MQSETLFRGVKRLKPNRFCPYDVIPPSPRDSELLGGAPIGPISITDFIRPTLTRFSQLALEWYNQEERSGVSFEFHDLVKSNHWIDVRARTHVPHGDTPPPPSPTTFYITFQAKPIGDPSSSHDIITFQAEISMEDELPVVQDCRIRSKQCFDECGRLEPLANEPELFGGLTFYFSGYDGCYKNFLQDLVETEGGAVLKSKDELEVVSDDAQLLVVYNPDSPQGCEVSHRLCAGDLTANYVDHKWILESFGAYIMDENYLDLSETGLLNPVKDQGKTGNCYAQVACLTAEYEYKKETGQDFVSSAQDVHENLIESEAQDEVQRLRKSRLMSLQSNMTASGQPTSA
ncbi:protein BREAST CANCER SUSCEPTIBILITY protein [Trifolium repens]|nr:protein BREAST CANCER SUSCEPTIBILITY protein [Trifolium repens]